MDYAEQTSWLLFLNYHEGLELDRATVADLGQPGQIGQVFAGFQQYLYL